MTATKGTTATSAAESILGAATPPVCRQPRSQPVPLDLETLFGDRFRVFMSEDHEPGSPRDPWNFELRGPGGAKVWPFGSTLLCAYVQGRVRRNRLLVFGEPFQVGDDEAVIRFPPEAFEAVAEYIKPYARRVLSEEQRDACAERLRKAREAAR